MGEERLQGGIKLGTINPVERVFEDALRSADSGIGPKKGETGTERGMATWIGGIRAHGDGEEIADAGFALRRAETGDGFRGEPLHPGIIVFQGGPELRRGSIGTRSEGP